MEHDFTYGFRIGDEVITSTGEVGTITHICDCSLCEERGFYEPTATMSSNIYPTLNITISDKNDNFKSFYKIGDKIFGNIDKIGLMEEIESVKEEIEKSKTRFSELEKQLEIIESLEKKI